MIHVYRQMRKSLLVWGLRRCVERDGGLRRHFKPGWSPSDEWVGDVCGALQAGGGTSSSPGWDDAGAAPETVPTRIAA